MMETGEAAARSVLLELADAALVKRELRRAHELLERALAEATDDGMRAEALERLGRVAQSSGRPRETVQLLEEALRLRRLELTDRLDLAESIGRAYAAVGELERAVLVFERSLATATLAGDVNACVRFASLLSYALTDCGDFEGAERAVATVIAAATGVEDPIVRARVEWAQARLRGEQGRPAVALAHAKRALALLDPDEEPQQAALTHELVASLLIDLGQPEEALRTLRAGWPLLLDSATPLQVAHYRIEEARALAATGERDGAAAVAMRVAAQLDGTHPGDAGRAYVLLGEIFNELGDVARARQLYKTAVGLLSRQGPSRYLAAAYKRLAELFEHAYRTEDALEVLRRALAIDEQLRSTSPELCCASGRPSEISIGGISCHSRDGGRLSGSRSIA